MLYTVKKVLLYIFTCPFANFNIPPGYKENRHQSKLSHVNLRNAESRILKNKKHYLRKKKEFLKYLKRRRKAEAGEGEGEREVKALFLPLLLLREALNTENWTML